jgi:hypothetical protein
MADNVMQHSFAAGELSPSLLARTDLPKYRSGAATMRNFFVDYRSGASTRTGLQFVNQTKFGTTTRLIPFQFDVNTGYVLEFGGGYIRFHFQGATILSGGIPYEVASPYAATDLHLLKFAQLTNRMILVHNNYPPYVLTAFGPTNWTLVQINFGTTVGTPTITSGTPTASGSANYSYIVTALDTNNQEGLPSTPFAVNSAVNIQTTAGSINLVWGAVNGATSYNVYKAEIGVGNVVPAGSAYGFVSNVTGTSLVDSNILPDFSQSPPISENPFIFGSAITGYTITTPGTYTSVPTVTIGAPPAGGTTATALASLGLASATFNNGSPYDFTARISAGNPTGSTFTIPNGVVFQIDTVSLISQAGAFNNWKVTGLHIAGRGSFTSGTPPTTSNSSSGLWTTTIPGFGAWNGSTLSSMVWGVYTIINVQGGSGYVSAPSVTFAPTGAVATANLGPQSGGNPGCTCFFQQRLYFAATAVNPTTFWASQPGNYYNFNVSIPTIDSDSITGTLVSIQLNAIKSMLPMPGGLLLLTDAGAWQLSSGAGGLASTAAVTPTNATATPQAYNGISDIPPLAINYDILYVQSKGSIVRDLAYNIYANIYTGSDISIMSNHLFFGHQVIEWCWSEEPFKTVWTIRDDGVLISLTYVKDQEMIGFARHDTDGLFKSTCVVREGQNDIPYFIVERSINGVWQQSVERMTTRYFPYGTEDAFCVDCGFSTILPQPAGTVTASSGSGAVTFSLDSPVLTTGVLRMLGGIATVTSITGGGTGGTGTWTQAINSPLPAPYIATQGNWTLATPSSTFTGMTYLNGMTVHILADGQVVTPQVVSGGAITLPFAATKVVAGLPYQCQLQTMYLDTGDPTVQGKRKAIPRMTVRTREARGIKMGRTFATIIPVKQFNGATPPNQLVTSDVYFVMDPLWEVFGQMCIQVDDPVPASILGVVPEIIVGDLSPNAPRMGK